MWHLIVLYTVLNFIFVGSTRPNGGQNPTPQLIYPSFAEGVPHFPGEGEGSTPTR